MILRSGKHMFPMVLPQPQETLSGATTLPLPSPIGASALGFSLRVAIGA